MEVSSPVLFRQGSDPTALSVLTQAITGQVGFMDADFCTSCGEKGAEKRCSICKMVIIWFDLMIFVLRIRKRVFFSWFPEVLVYICACIQVIYCGQACQKLHWFSHKKVCKMLQEQREKHEADSASRLQKQAKGIQIKFALLYYDT